MFVPRSKFKRCGLAAVALLVAACGPLRAQTTGSQTAEPPRVGEVAPAFDLASQGTGTARVASRDFLGRRAQFWVIEGDKPLGKADAGVVKAAQSVVARGIAPLLFASGGQGSEWPAPFQVLDDEEASVSRALGVPSGVLGNAPAFVAVDRAGWVRDIEPLPTGAEDAGSFALRFLLERSPDPTPVFAVGKAAPDFCIRDASGVWRRLSSLRGRKNLVLTFFPRCFTGKCKSHMESLRDNFGAFQLGDTEVWAVSVDAAGGEQGQSAFARSLQLPFPLLPDEGRNICFLFDAVQTPTDLAKRQSVLIDKDGIVRFVDRDVAPLTHGEDVLARLKTLGMVP